MIKKSVIACILYGWSLNLFGQDIGTSLVEPKPSKLILPEWVNHLMNDTGSSAKPRILFYPTIGFSPETRWEFGASGLVVFHYNNDTTLRLSEISAFGFYTEILGLSQENRLRNIEIVHT